MRKLLGSRTTRCVEWSVLRSREASAYRGRVSRWLAATVLNLRATTFLRLWRLARSHTARPAPQMLASASSGHSTVPPGPAPGALQPIGDHHGNTAAAAADDGGGGNRRTADSLRRVFGDGGSVESTKIGRAHV